MVSELSKGNKNQSNWDFVNILSKHKRLCLQELKKDALREDKEMRNFQIMTMDDNLFLGNRISML